MTINKQLTGRSRAESVACWSTPWIVYPKGKQEVVAFGSPADAGRGGRIAVRQHADVLQRLADA